MEQSYYTHVFTITIYILLKIDKQYILLVK
jgi:hypothetical protein